MVLKTAAEITSWTNVYVPVEKDRYMPRFHLIVGGSVIAKTAAADKIDNKWWRPRFFLNVVDMPMTDAHAMDIEIVYGIDPERVDRDSLRFDAGVRARNPDLEFLVEYYDKDYEEQVDRNLFRFMSCKEIPKHLPPTTLVSDIKVGDLIHKGGYGMMSRMYEGGGIPYDKLLTDYRKQLAEMVY